MQHTYKTLDEVYKMCAVLDCNISLTECSCRTIQKLPICG